MGFTSPTKRTKEGAIFYYPIEHSVVFDKFDCVSYMVFSRSQDYCAEIKSYDKAEMAFWSRPEVLYPIEPALI